MAEYLIQSETLDAIADAINAKTGGASAMTPAEMVTAIGSISGGGEKVYTKLAEFQFTEPVVSFTLTLTEQMKNLECLYLVLKNVTLSEETWVYPKINNKNSYGYTDRLSVLDGTFVFTPIKTPLASVIRRVGGTFAVNNAGNTPVSGPTNSVGFSGNITGGSVEVWGYV